MTISINYLLESVAPVRERIMYFSTATDLATICYTCPILLTQTEKKQYLHPLRDMPAQEQWIQSERGKGSKVTIVGKDLPWEVMRIRKPREYWSRVDKHMRIRLWILALPGDLEKEDTQMAIDRLQDELERRLLQVRQQNEDEQRNVDREDSKLNVARVKDEIDFLYTKMIRTKKPCGSWMKLADVCEEDGTCFNMPSGQNPLAVTDPETFRCKRISPEWLQCTDTDTDLIELVHLDAFVNRQLCVFWVPSSIARVSINGLATRSVVLTLTQTTFRIREHRKSYRGSMIRYVSPYECSIELKAQFGDSFPDRTRIQLSIEI